MSGGGADVSAAIREQAEEACTTMHAALAALKDSSDASCPVPTRQQVAAAVQLVRVEVAKVGLVYNQGGTAGSTTGNGSTSPTDAEASSLLKDFQHAVCTLCMVFTGIAASDRAGPTLRASLRHTATSVVESCVALVRGAVLGGARDAQLMMLSGFCLEMLGAAEKAPVDSRTAIGRAITQVLRQMADAVKELSEEVQSAEEAAAAGAAGSDGGAEHIASAEKGQQEGLSDSEEEEDDESDAGFGMFQSEAFSPCQLAVARLVHGVLEAAVGMVKAVVRQLLADRDGLTAEGVEGWESMLYHIKALGPTCDDLSAATYPPQDCQELASASEALATGCELLQDECPAPAAAADGEAGEGAASGALQPAMEAVQKAHDELAAELAGAGNGAAEEEPATSS